MAIETPQQLGIKSRVVVVDDHPMVCRGLAELIALEPDLEFCGGAGDADDAIALIRSVRPNLVVVDLTLKHSHGIGLIEAIHAFDRQVKVLVATVHDESLFAERVLRAGASGYVNKREPAEKLLEAMRTILQGGIYLSPQASNRLLQSLVDGCSPEEDPIRKLSRRELEVFEMIGQGLSTKQIANRLHLSIKTIETHREKIRDKLGLSNATELMLHAIRWVLEGK